MTSPNWATQQLAEFLAVLTGAASAGDAITLALERLAESFEADAGAFVRGEAVVSSLGWAAGSAPVAELVEATRKDRTTIEIPNIGPCDAVVVPVDRDEGTWLLLARFGYRFNVEDIGLLRGMARVLALGLRLLGTVAAERQQVEQNRELVRTLRERQDLLERLSRLQRQITARVPLREILDTVTSGAAELLGGNEVVSLVLLDESDTETLIVRSAAGPGAEELPGHRIPLSGTMTWWALLDDRLVTGDLETTPVAFDRLSRYGLHSAIAAPVHRDGRSVGALLVASRELPRQFTESERELLMAFADHASLALNDAQVLEAMRNALQSATYQAMHDELTGLPNRACFYERTERALCDATLDGTNTAVLLFDLNRFKEINDTLGHKYGDRVLREIGPKFREELRECDTLARLGGDEFCVLLPRVDGIRGALAVAERLVGVLDEPFDIDGMTMDVQASCGVAVAPLDGDSVDVLLQRSDVALYVAKDSHAKVVRYDDQLNTNTPARLALLGELRGAIAREQFVLYYQPKAAFGRDEIEGVEALLRWRHPTLGLIPPNDFIPLAEQSGLIKSLTTWVLDAALDQLRRWRSGEGGSIPGDFTVAINLSTRSLLDESFPGEVAAALQRSGIPPRLLELEITESMIMADPTLAHRVLTELASLGVKLSIDDFGTGYSSLAYLKNLPVDQLKIDKSFVLHMHRDPNDALIVRSVIELGHNLGLHVVAEGIEHVETWIQLTTLGCDSGQGYLLARPMPAEELSGWIREKAGFPIGNIAA